MKNEKMIMGMVVGAAAVVGAMYLMNRRTAMSVAKTGNSEDASNAVGRKTIALKNPCGAKLGEECEAVQGDDWFRGTWQSGGYGKPCVCKKGSATTVGRPNIWTRSTKTAWQF